LLNITISKSTKTAFGTVQISTSWRISFLMHPKMNWNQFSTKYWNLSKTLFIQF